MIPIVLRLISLSFFLSVVFSSPPLTCSIPLLWSQYTYGIPSWHSDNYTCPTRSQMYKIAPSQGKGLGAFAAQTLRSGDVILREEPVIIIQLPTLHEGVGYNAQEVRQRVRNEFDLLSEEARADIMLLSSYANGKDVNSPDYDRLGSIFRSNAYNSGDKVGLFPKIARINHSCRPNTSYFWNEKEKRRVVYATRQIEEGEELSVSYISLLATHADRQKQLDHYGFDCACEACGTKHLRSASDKRRLAIKQAFFDLEPQITLKRPETVVAKKKAQRMAKESKKLVSLVEEEELADYYARAYRIAAVCHASLQQWEPAALWANKSYQFRLMADSQSPETREMEILTGHFVQSWNDLLRNNSLGRG
ncbi:hypothetical protein B0J11DRAFT_274580 [Dendryphion nanum]|uniref:SET domain-containing protein n=1 Tax=Dendryphion nanum TaxID=256645 RepID=A0A9P9E0V9_9PLEO|nr:hypothetical protein B0J11DRAFT_274580 [Dendryphion nanum]